MNIAFTAATLAKWVAFGSVRVRSVSGFNNQSSDVFIQLHEVSKGTVAAAQVAPANGTVPKFKSLHAQANNSFKWEFEDGIVFSELVVCMSTTEANLTLVGANGGVDFTLVADGPYMVDNFPTLTVVGDLTNAVSSVQVWAEAAGPHTLMRVDVVNQINAVVYILGCTEDTVPSTAKPFYFGKLAANATGTYSEGQGTAFFDKTALDQALHQGMNIIVNDTNDLSGVHVNGMVCRAMYI